MSRLALAVLPLALVALLSACEEVLPPEPEPEVVALVLSGYLAFEPDTVRVSIGDTLVMKHHPSCEINGSGSLSECRRWADPPEAGPGQVLLTYRRFSPRVIGCLDAAHYTDLLDAPAPIQFLCSEVIEHYRETRPDSLFRADESVMEAMAYIMPCARDENGDPLNPEAFSSQGGFTECWTWGTTKIGRGPGLGDTGELVAVECGWSWVSRTRRTGRDREWLPPFDGYARVEIEVVGC